MNKIAVVYWSGTGNTAMMATYIVEGAKEAGAQVDLKQSSEFTQNEISNYDAIAFGCPSMGAEELEDTEYEPMFTSCKGQLKDKNIALFGSYGWGDGEWMRTWEEDCKSFGANLVCASLIVNEEPDDDAKAKCKTFGADLAN